MSESDMRRHVVRSLRELDAFAVENPAHPGTPDINYKEGWIECKWDKQWPVREETPLRIDHFTRQQRFFLRQRWARGGNVFLLLNVARDWLLFDGLVAATHVGYMARDELCLLARNHWVGRGAMQMVLRHCLSR